MPFPQAKRFACLQGDQPGDYLIPFSDHYPTPAFFTNNRLEAEPGSVFRFRAERTKVAVAITDVATEKMFASGVNHIPGVGGPEIPLQWLYRSVFTYMAEKMGSKRGSKGPRAPGKWVYKTFRMQLPEMSKRPELRRDGGYERFFSMSGHRTTSLCQ
ncbi:hypothetical protein D3C78_1392910 [compost metagenome]